MNKYRTCCYITLFNVFIQLNLNSHSHPLTNTKRKTFSSYPFNGQDSRSGDVADRIRIR